MKHPAWCEEDDCEAGWHMASASYSNDGYAQIEVRLSQDIKTGKFELDLGKGNGDFNSYKELKDVKRESEALREFVDVLNTLIEAIES